MTTLRDPRPDTADRTGGIRTPWSGVAARRGYGPAVLVIIAAVIGLSIVGLLVAVVIISVNTNGFTGPLTLDNYADLFSDDFALKVLGNTALYVLVSTITAIVIGVPAAWLVERSDLAGKSVVSAIFVIGVLIPGFFVAMGWLFMFHPNAGVVNQMIATAFGLDSGPFDVVTIPSMGFIQGLGLASVVFAMTSTTFKTMDISLEEAARAAGGTFLKQIARVTLPLAWPSILAATLYVAIIAFGAFDVPAIIGLSAREFTFSTFLYYSVNPQIGLPKYGMVAAFSTVMIVVGILLSWAYSRVLKRGNRYRVITGKNYRPTLIPLGRWAWLAWTFFIGYFVLAKALPLLAVIWTALLPYQQPPSADALASITLNNLFQLPWGIIGNAALHTLVLVLVVPTLAMAFSTITSWVVIRSKVRFRAVFDYVAFIPHAVPSLIMGISALLLALFVLPKSWGLYGSIALIAIVMGLEKVSFGTRMTNSGLLQLHPELEEAAAVSGAGTLTSFRRVLFPLLRPTFLNGWLWIGILTFRELTLPLIMFSPANVTLAVEVWNLWAGGKAGQAAMLTVLMLAAVTPLAILYQRVSRGNAGPA